MKPQDEIACSELVEVITDYLEGTLAEDDRRRLERHLEDCAYCIEYIEQLRQTVEALGALSREAVALETRRELLEAFGRWRDR